MTTIIFSILAKLESSMKGDSRVRHSTVETLKASMIKIRGSSYDLGYKQNRRKEQEISAFPIFSCNQKPLLSEWKEWYRTFHP